jgi:hypothetical protein
MRSNTAFVLYFIRYSPHREVFHTIIGDVNDLVTNFFIKFYLGFKILTTLELYVAIFWDIASCNARPVQLWTGLVWLRIGTDGELL